MILDKYNQIQGDYVGIVRSPCALIPPIFMMDEHGRCVEWNDAMQKLSSLKRERAIDQMLLGQDANKLIFGFFDQKGKYVEAILSANKRTNTEGRITGILCFLHVASPELQYTMQVQSISEQATANTQTKLAYILGEVRNPLNGIKLLQNLMKYSDLSKEQRQLLKTSALCREQLAKIIDDGDIESIEGRYDVLA
ncbi:phytochrome C-like [Olea europaea var. sylvestris]|uniref:phytochrome C-like n=1 Tax=Olea europaea var. sylvestris TaxID=158386 RepID=UPI000C1CE91A|nr:phytochrome C-like [Olea europaea var. sylvestris]